MRFVLFAYTLAIVLAALACGDGSSRRQPSPSPQPTFEAEGDVASAQLIADLRNSQSSNARIAYHATLQGDIEVKADVTWYTDSVDHRQRFDFSKAEELVGVEDASVFTEGDRDRIVICSDQFPVDPNAELDSSGPKGACCEGSSSCGDIAGNAIYFLGFPLGYADEPDEPTVDDGWEIDVSKREIAGVAARCYRVADDEPDEFDDPWESQVCFSATGAIVYRKREATTYDGALEVEAYAVGTPVPEDFEYPYAVYLDPGESQ
ncbi:MAG: hypothetical protein EPO22_05165 [Dehalococcoidia bacterium]|nr:MAG: hypothetical protein EPO22_05165 [Dehalococcoidia bacterium]